MVVGEILMSRELDAEIAEKVMGFKFKKSSGISVSGKPWNDVWVKDGMAQQEPDPCSTDIKAAWEVVAALRNRGFNIIFYMRDDGKNCVRFTKEASIKATEKWTDFEIPEAICRAALKAVENE